MTGWNRIWLFVALVTLLLALSLGVFGGVPGIIGMLFYWVVVVGLLYPVGRTLMRWSTDPVHVLIGIATTVAAWFAAVAIDGTARMMLRVHMTFGADLPGPTLFALGAVTAYVPWILAAVATALVAWGAIRAPRYFVHICAATAIALAITLSLAAFALVILPSMRCEFEWPSLSTGKAPDATAAKRDAPVGSCGPI